MHQDKKRWWAVNFCRPTAKAMPNPALNVLVPIGMCAAVMFTVMAVALLMTMSVGAGTVAAAGVIVAAPKSMRGLEKHLKETADPRIQYSAEFSATIEDLQNGLIDLNQQMKNIQSKADSEKRPLTVEEKRLVDDLFNRFESTEDEIDRRARIAASSEKLGRPAGRKTEPTPLNYGEAGRTRPVSTTDTGKFGFNSFGEFAQRVKHACMRGVQNVDPRLIAMAAPTTSTEDVGSDGGFAVPPDFRADIMQKVLGEESLLVRTDQLTSTSNAITIPKDETTPWQGTGGIQAYWEGEITQIPASKMALETMTVKLNKLTSLVPCSDELLEDAAALSSYLRRKAPEKINFKITDAIVNGTGAGMPLGLTKANAKISVAKETSQAAASLLFNNVVKMYARLYTGCRKNAIWLINQDIEPQLLALQFPGTGTAVPVYLPPGGLSGSPYGVLMGKPVIPTEACQTIGTEGDIILTDLSAYLTATKIGGMRQDVSIHLYFDYDITAFRFVMRVGGQPWWNTSITPKNGSNTRSCIVTLADRA